MESVKLADSFTLFFYAFHAPRDFYRNVSKNIPWIPSQLAPDPSFLFPHVQEFFIRNSELPVERTDENEALIFELKTEELSEAEKEFLFLYNNFFKRNHLIEIDQKSIEFVLIRDKTLLSPKLIFVPLSGIGILTFGLKPANASPELSDLLDLNYHLRIFSAGQVQAIKTVRNTHPRAAEQEQRIENSLLKIQDTWIGDSYFQWNIKNLISYLLSGQSEKCKTLSPSRLQAFTYVNLQENLPGDDLKLALFRLRRVYSESYIPAKKFLDSNRETEQTFDKIHYGATVEGATIVVEPAEGLFFRNYAQTILQRTLWTYFLAYHQRYALIAVALDTNSLYQNNREPATSELSELVDRICKVQLKCMFEEVSHYTQQNDFYYLCYNNLKIGALFREVKEEVDELNKILTERWREQEEIRRRYEEKLVRHNQRMLEIVLALLIIPQIWFAVLSTNLTTWQNFMNKNISIVNVVNLGIWFIILFIVFRLFVYRKIFSSHKQKIR